MSLNISSESLRSILKLTEKRESLAAEIAKIDEQISNALGRGNGVAATGHVTGNGRKTLQFKRARKTSKRNKRGAVKEMILAGLKEAGEKGTAVKDLGAKLDIKPQNIHVWLHTTGKKSGLVEAVSKGIYRLKQSQNAETAASPSKTSKAAAPERTKKVSKNKIPKAK